MNLTKAQNTNSMLLESARIEISTADVEIDTVKKTWEIKELLDLGLARGIKIGFASSKIDIKADNGDVPIKGITGVKGTVEFALLERHLPVMAKVMGGLVHLKTKAHDPKKETEILEANTITADNLIKFKFQNFDLKEPADIVVKQDSKTLNKGADYTIEKDSSGLYGVKFKSGGGFDSAKGTSLEYTVARIKSYVMTKGSGGIAKNLAMKLTNLRNADNGKLIKRTFEFPFGFYDGEDSVSFKSKNDGDNVVEVPMKFEFTPHPDMLLDKKLEKMSLYREEMETA